MARFTAVAAILFILGLLINLAFSQSAFGVIEAIGLVGLVISSVYYLAHYSRRIIRRLLWRVRNKIIVSYAFVGFIPVAILALIGWVAFRLLFGQLSALYLEQEIRIVGEGLREATQETVLEFYSSGAGRADRLLELATRNRGVWLRDRPLLTSYWVGIFVRRDAAYRLTGGVPAGPAPLILPEWIKAGFQGLVHDTGRLYFRSVVPVETREGPALLTAQIPFDNQAVRHIEERTSISLTPPTSVDPSASPPAAGGVFRGGVGFLTTINWMHRVAPLDWNTGSATRFLESELSLFAISVPIDQLYYNFYFSQETNLGRFLISVVTALGIIFVMVEAFSLFIGIAIARSITRSIRNIDLGTQRIREGDFDYRIESSKNDQLDSLAEAFNQMSVSIRGLMGQVTEKERMDQELEIAREVQTRLFPRVLPRTNGIELAAHCLPARSVSGDYYDFIPYGEEQVDIVIGDISGKGISAALLMASLQSAIRTHVVYQTASHRFGEGQISQAVAAINSHLYAQTAADKFATLVFGHYNANLSRLTYCNAGHNPPFLISDGQIRLLRTGGMAVGLFSDRHYEEETVELASGDLVIFYTDGVVEADDGSGEQFEEKRLIDLVQQNSFLTANDIQKLILDEVMAFSGSQAQRDDITVVVLKVT